MQRIRLIENLFPGCIKIYKELSNLNNKKTDNTINNIQKILTETLSKIEMSNIHEKTAQLISHSENAN